MNLTALPAFSDNYIWLVDDGAQAVAIDPGDVRPVIDALNHRKLTLQAILLTHHHPDHVGGVAELKGSCGSDLTVYGPSVDRHPLTDVPLADNATLSLLGAQVDVRHVPGHTLNHLAYLWRRPEQAGWMFSGDTLFSAGCGRLFEGTAEQMLSSLDRLSAEPDDTLVCCAHEYTVANLRFAQAVEPSNQAIEVHLQSCLRQREQGLMTLPTPLGRERLINPFLRAHVPEVAARTHQPGEPMPTRAAVWAHLRSWKNNFR